MHKCIFYDISSLVIINNFNYKCILISTFFTMRVTTNRVFLGYTQKIQKIKETKVDTLSSKERRHFLKELFFVEPSEDFVSSLLSIASAELVNPTQGFKLLCHHLNTHCMYFDGKKFEDIKNLLEKVLADSKNDHKYLCLLYNAYFNIMFCKYREELLLKSIRPFEQSSNELIIYEIVSSLPTLGDIKIDDERQKMFFKLVESKFCSSKSSLFKDHVWMLYTVFKQKASPEMKNDDSLYKGSGILYLLENESDMNHDKIRNASFAEAYRISQSKHFNIDEAIKLYLNKRGTENVNLPENEMYLYSSNGEVAFNFLITIYNSVFVGKIKLSDSIIKMICTFLPTGNFTVKLHVYLLLLIYSGNNSLSFDLLKSMTEDLDIDIICNSINFMFKVYTLALARGVEYDVLISHVECVMRKYPRAFRFIKVDNLFALFDRFSLNAQFRRLGEHIMPRIVAFLKEIVSDEDFVCILYFLSIFSKKYSLDKKTHSSVNKLIDTRNDFVKSIAKAFK